MEGGLWGVCLWEWFVGGVFVEEFCRSGCVVVGENVVIKVLEKDCGVRLWFWSVKEKGLCGG